MKDKLKLYVASPLGFSEAGRYFLYGKLIPCIEKAGFEVIDPWKLTSQKLIDKVQKMPLGKKKAEAWAKLNLLIGSNNCEAIFKSDGLVAVLDGSDVDSGTAAEIGYGAGLNKSVVGYRGDFRSAGENLGCVINLQVEYFIKMLGGSIVDSLPGLKKELKRIFNKG